MPDENFRQADRSHTSILAAAEKKALIAIAARLPCALVVDEAYGDFADANCLDLVRGSDRVIVTRSFSSPASTSRGTPPT